MRSISVRQARLSVELSAESAYALIRAVEAALAEGQAHHDRAVPTLLKPYLHCFQERCYGLRRSMAETRSKS